MCWLSVSISMHPKEENSLRGKNVDLDCCKPFPTDIM